MYYYNYYIHFNECNEPCSCVVITNHHPHYACGRDAFTWELVRTFCTHGTPDRLRVFHRLMDQLNAAQFRQADYYEMELCNYVRA